MRACQPKDVKTREAPGPILTALFMFFPLPLSLPCVNWSSQEGCLFYLRSSLWSLDLPLFYFCRLFPSLSFRHHHSTLLFPILTNNLKCRKQFSSFQFWAAVYSIHRLEVLAVFSLLSVLESAFGDCSWMEVIHACKYCLKHQYQDVTSLPGDQTVTWLRWAQQGQQASSTHTIRTSLGSSAVTPSRVCPRKPICCRRDVSANWC